MNPSAGFGTGLIGMERMRIWQNLRVRVRLQNPHLQNKSDVSCTAVHADCRGVQRLGQNWPGIMLDLTDTTGGPPSRRG